MGEDKNWLGEIEAMARADHAHGLSSRYDPYPPGTSESQAWQAGWKSEAGAERPLDEALAMLPVYRITVSVVRMAGDGEKVLEELPREDWPSYSVQRTERSDAKGALFRSREVAAKYPDPSDIAVRVDYETHVP